MRTWLGWIVGAAAVVVVVYAFSKYADYRIGDSSGLVGNPAPEITGDFAINGKPITLAKLKGKVVLLDFWATWCPPCIDSFSHLRQWQDEFKSEGLEIVGLTMYNDAPSERREEQAMLRTFAAKHKLDHLLMNAPDPDYDKICQAYGIKAYPTVILIDRKGIVRMVQVGGGPRSAKAIESEIKELLAERG